MTKILLIATFACSIMHALGGPTVEANGDIINYAQPAAPRGTQYIVVATDSAQHEPRWHAMLDDRDLRNLIYLEAGKQGDNGNVFIFSH